MVPNSNGQDHGDTTENPNGVLNYPYSAPGSGGEVPADNDSEPSQLYIEITVAHAVLGLLAFGLFFPLGSILLRTLPHRGTVWLHAGWQLLTLAMAVTSMGIGVRMVRDPAMVDSDFIHEPHAIIGLVTICTLIAVQPATGVLQHLRFRRTGSRTAFSYAHMLLGIPLITLGAINGGLGLRLSEEPMKYTVTYGVLAGVVWVIWMSISVISQVMRDSTAPRRTKRSGSDEDGLSMRQTNYRSAKY